MSGFVRPGCRTDASSTYTGDMHIYRESAMDAAARQVKTNVCALGTHVVICIAAPRLGLAIVAIELMLAATVLITALYASKTLSDRAFRMIPWAAKPEPEVPATEPPDKQSSRLSTAM